MPALKNCIFGKVMRKKIHSFYLAFIFLSNLCFSQGIFFSENKGQWQNNIHAKSKIPGGDFYILNNELRYLQYNPSHDFHHFNSKKTNDSIWLFCFNQKFLLDNKEVEFKQIENQNEIPSTRENYFLGNNPDRWKSGIKRFKKLVGINKKKDFKIEVIGHHNSVKLNYILNSNFTDKFKIKYSEHVKLNVENNVLKIITPFGTWSEKIPLVYQFIDGKQKILNCTYLLEENNIVSFKIENVKKNVEIVIDPELVFCTYSGSVGDNFGMSATYDNDGFAYSGGTVFATGFPVSLGAYDSTAATGIGYGTPDVGILKYTPNGQQLVYATYLGGERAETIHSMVADSLGNLYVFGATGSNDFPATTSAVQNVFSGGSQVNLNSVSANFIVGSDGYVSKFSPNGSQLLASTYFGGNGDDAINFADADLVRNYGDNLRGEIILDESGNCLIITTTTSANIQTTNNAIQSSIGGLQDVLLLKLNSDLSQILYQSYFGSTENECGNGIANIGSGKILIGGGTKSSDLPFSNNLNFSYLGFVDGFLSIIDLNNSALSNTIYLGTPFYDQVFFVQKDFEGNNYCFVQTSGAFNPIGNEYNVFGASQIVMCFDSTLQNVLFRSGIGNGNGINISPGAFLVDNCKRIYISGWGGTLIANSSMNDMPITADAFKDTTDGRDFYLCVLSENAGELLYGTYFGGNSSAEHVDGGTSRFDSKGIVYQSVCAGCGAQQDFPVTPGAWSTVNASNNCNNGIFKMDFRIPSVVASISSPDLEGCVPFTANFSNNSQNASLITWTMPDGTSFNNLQNTSYTFNSPGTYQVKLKAKSSLSCETGEFDSTFVNVVVHPLPDASFSYVTNDCKGTVLFTNNSTASPNETLSYLWAFGDNNSSTEQNPIHGYLSDGNYSVKLIAETNQGCKDSITFNITIEPYPTFTVSNDTSLCYPSNSIQLQAAGGEFYRWFPSNGLSNPNNAITNATVDSSTQYFVDIYSVSAIGDTCGTTLSVNVVYSLFSSQELILTSSSDTIFEGESVTLNSNINGNSNQWVNFNTQEIKNGAEVNYSISQSSLFLFTTEDIYGCRISDTIRIYTQTKGCPEGFIKIPNVFSPNNDNINDAFKPIGKGFNAYKLKIFDRYGKKIFEGTEFNNGWNGTIDGKISENGVYSFIIEVDCNGGEKYYKQGNVTLIR